MDVLPSTRREHLELAWAAAEAESSQLSREFLRKCRLLAIWSLQEQLAVEDLAVQLHLALKRFPRDPDLLLAKGSLWELLASIGDVRGYDFQRNEATEEIAREYRGRVELRTEQPWIYQQCTRLYESALERAPHHVELRVRLARVLTEVGRNEEAAAALKPLDERNDIEPRLRYLAALFRGRALLQAGNAAAAAAPYRSAITLFPGCQTPYLALSSAVRASGDRGSAREIIMGMMSMRANCPFDPWVAYAAGQAWRMEQTIAELIQGLRR